MSKLSKIFKKPSLADFKLVSPSRITILLLYENFISKRATLLSGAYLFLINSKLE